MRIKARAKINWTLDITGRREDGYHFMDMLMQPLSLSDELEIQPAKDLSLQVEGAALSAGEDNLVMRSARRIQAAAGAQLGAKITLFKRIPMGAGLGGGSADAAAVLKALNALWQIGFSREKLCAIGEEIGADVPFCIMDRPMRVQGIGERMHPITVGRTYPLLLLQPCAALSTRDVFLGFQDAPPPCHPETEKCLEALKNGDLAPFKEYGGNVLEAVSIRKRPEILTAKDDLYRAGAAFAQMTGSGSVVFGAFENRAAAEAAKGLLMQRYPSLILTETAF